jgi:hypothetical protein
MAHGTDISETGIVLVLQHRQWVHAHAAQSIRFEHMSGRPCKRVLASAPVRDVAALAVHQCADDIPQRSK